MLIVIYFDINAPFSCHPSCVLHKARNQGLNFCVTVHH